MTISTSESLSKNHLSRREFVRKCLQAATATGLASFIFPRQVFGQQKIDCLAQARELHRQVPVFMGYVNGFVSETEKFEAAGIRTYVASLGYGCYFQTGRKEEFERAGPDDWLFKKMRDLTAQTAKSISSSSRHRLITKADQLKRGAKDTSMDVIMHMTGNNQIVDLAALEEFFKLGVRSIHPAFHYHDRFCRGVDEGPVHGKGPVLSDFGKEVIARMNQLGIMLDLAHSADESAQAMIRASTKPVIDSHTASGDVVPFSRGHSDKTLRMIADSGGVIGVHFADHMQTTRVWQTKYKVKLARVRGEMLSRQWRYNADLLAKVKDPDERMRLRRDSNAMKQFYQENNLQNEPSANTKDRIVTLSDMADMVDYLVKLVGIEGVGLGGDIYGIDDHEWPVGMDNITQLANLTAELLERGYKEDTLKKILSDNWRRVYAAGLSVSAS